MSPSPDAEAVKRSMQLSAVVDKLVQQQWCVLTDFFSPDLCRQLYDELQAHAAQSQLQPARVGKDQKLTRDTDIRGDDILWLDGSSAAQTQFLDVMQQLKQKINRELYLGLDELEAHYALYPPGMGYQRHLDSFQNNNLRRITIVAYLNDEWVEEAGGQLNIYDGDAIMTSVLPLAGTLVCFVSERWPHEVAVTHRWRSSIAGWFRCRPS